MKNEGICVECIPKRNVFHEVMILRAGRRYALARPYGLTRIDICVLAC